MYGRGIWTTELGSALPLPNMRPLTKMYHTDVLIQSSVVTNQLTLIMKAEAVATTLSFCSEMMQMIDQQKLRILHLLYQIQGSYIS
jgi:hypothetical protein